jgi:hypothetical protein
MKIRYNVALAIVMLVFGVFILGTSLLLGTVSPNTIVGVMVLAIAFAYLFRPAGELTERELTLFALVGPLKKQYPAAQLRFVDGKLYCGDQKVRVAAWVVNSADWRALQERVQRKEAA